MSAPKPSPIAPVEPPKRRTPRTKPLDSRDAPSNPVLSPEEAARIKKALGL